MSAHAFAISAAWVTVSTREGSVGADDQEVEDGMGDEEDGPGDGHDDIDVLSSLICVYLGMQITGIQYLTVN